MTSPGDVAGSVAARVLPPLPADARISVIMPVRDAATVLPDSVAAVLAQQPAVDEVVLAVGPSRDDTAAVAARLAAADPRVRVVPNPRGHTPDALNAAIAASDAEVVVRVDTHAVLPPGYIATALAALRATGAANVGGMQVPTADTGVARAVAAAMRSPAGAGGATYRQGGGAGPVDTVYLGVFRRTALAAVGGFDPRFVRNQDAELNERLRRAGFTVWFEPALAVTYTPRGSLSALARQYLGYGRWRRLTGRVHRGSLRPRQLAAPTLVVGLAAALGLSVVTRRAAPAALAVGGYAAGLTAAAIPAADTPRDVPAVAAALATMHLSWGAGFLLGPPREADVAGEG